MELASRVMDRLLISDRDGVVGVGVNRYISAVHLLSVQNKMPLLDYLVCVSSNSMYISEVDCILYPLNMEDP